MTRTTPRAHVCVLGAGMQGSCLALDLARRGLRVTLLEREPEPMLGASVRNEGKIHLGFVYALDATGTTRAHMLEGAWRFGPLLDELCGPLPWDAWRSAGFLYAPMPGSLAGPEEIEAAYRHLDVLQRELRAGPGGDALHYAGTRPASLWRRRDDAPGRPRPGGVLVERCWQTVEASIDPRPLTRAVAARVRADHRIDLRCGVAVESAARSGSGFVLALRTSEGDEECKADLVANCTWGDRIRLDRTLGIPPRASDPCYRVKYQVLVRPRRPDHGLVPVTMVQGPFGDIVPWSDGLVYASWYPEARTYFGDEPPPPPPDGEAERVATRSLAALARLFPALEGAEVVSSLPCLILARGATDVHDPESALHARSGLGAMHHDGWWSLDPGKFTLTPWEARRTAERIVRELGGAA